MSPYLQILYDEHEVIVNALDVVQQAKFLIDKDEAQYEKTIRQLLDFFRNYADKFHHHKEEIILFPEMNKRNELLQDGVVKEMFNNHEDFREVLRKVEKYLDEKNYERVQQQLDYYSEALLDHIAVENDEVFQMAETLFSDDELEKISHRFDDADRELDSGKKEQYPEMIDNLRKQFILAD